MINYFKQVLETVYKLILVFFFIIQFKIRLIFWQQITETILFESFLKDENSQIFIANYFPNLYIRFNYLYSLSLTNSENEP
jgi:hypothetical protein